MEGFGAILAFVVAMVIVHFLKFVIYWGKSSFRRPREAFSRGLASGGMPSGHTADMVAITMYMGLWQGFDSAIFALAVAVTAIIVYDATHVRYAVGIIGEDLNRLTGKKKRVYEGHTLAQVVVGGLVGASIGWGVFVIIG